MIGECAVAPSSKAVAKAGTIAVDLRTEVGSLEGASQKEHVLEPWLEPTKVLKTTVNWA